MEWQDGSAAIQRAWQDHETWSVETSGLLRQGRLAPDELPTEAASLGIVLVATEAASGAVRPAPEERLTEVAALRIVVVAAEAASGAVRPAPEERLTEVAALRIVLVATEVATGAAPLPSGQLPDAPTGGTHQRARPWPPQHGFE